MAVRLEGRRRVLVEPDECVDAEADLAEEHI